MPAEAPSETARFLAWAELRIADAGVAGGRLFPCGLPAGWEGNNFEVYGVPTGATSTVSFAIRWHGERPAVLWEQSGDAVALGAPVLAPDWHILDSKQLAAYRA